MELELPEKVANRIKDLVTVYSMAKSQIDLVINTFIDSTNPDHSGSNWRLSDDGTKIIKMEEVK